MRHWYRTAHWYCACRSLALARRAAACHVLCLFFKTKLQNIWFIFGQNNNKKVGLHQLVTKKSHCSGYSSKSVAALYYFWQLSQSVTFRLFVIIFVGFYKSPLDSFLYWHKICQLNVQCCLMRKQNAISGQILR